MARIRAVSLPLVAAGWAVGLLGCTGNSATRYRGAAAPPAAVASPAPAYVASGPACAPTRPMTFRFDVGDELSFSVWKEPELATSQRILRDGTIAPPLLKAMPVVGLTLDEVQGRLEAGYTEYLKEPKVSVKVVSIRSDRVFVLGEVRTPQAVSFIGPTTVAEAVTQAGGFDQKYADQARVHLIHKGPNGQLEVVYVNLANALVGRGNDPRVEAGDIVYVPPTGVTNWARNVGQALEPITGALSSASSVAALVIAARN